MQNLEEIVHLNPENRFNHDGEFDDELKEKKKGRK